MKSRHKTRKKKKSYAIQFHTDPVLHLQKKYFRIVNQVMKTYIRKINFSIKQKNTYDFNFLLLFPDIMRTELLKEVAFRDGERLGREGAERG